MLLGLKNLSLFNKIIFALSLLLLFIWVIPSMVNYYKNMQAYEVKAKELKSMALKYDVEGEAQPFDIETFTTEAEDLFSEALVASESDKLYGVVINMDKEQIEDFNDFLETLSLRYLVKVNGPIEFKEKDKLLEVKMTLQSL